MTSIEKKKLLLSIEKEANDFLKTAPNGSIRATRIGKHYRFYLMQNGKQNYLGRDSVPLIKDLAFKKYCQMITKEIKELKKDSYLVAVEDQTLYNKLGNVYLEVNRELRQYIKPFVLPDDLYIKQWLKKKGTPNPISFGNSEYYTANNERVRSKSELIIADKLKYAGIPYKYEAELVLSNNMRYYPDFTLLNIKTREEVYIEHCGMMDSAEYRTSVYKKLANYAIGGIHTGKNLILFFEDNASALNTIIVDMILKSEFGNSKKN